MARCLTQALAGIERPCSSKGGIKTEIYITLKENIGEYTFTETEEPYNTINSLPLKDSAKWYKFEFNKNAVNFTNTAVYDSQTNEFSYFDNALNLSFRKMDASMRLAIMSLLQNETVVVLEDNNGIKYVMGLEEYVSSTSASFDTGVNKTDSNVFSITLSDTTSALPYQLTDTAWESIIANVNE